MFMEDNFKLDDAKNLIPCTASEAWDFKSKNRDKCRVARTQVGESDISTVFLAMDHNFDGVGPPLVFETMIFGGTFNMECERYSTWGRAEAGHKAWVEKVTEDGV